MSREITEKQRAWTIAMYTIGSLSFGNGTESARKAGYKGTDNMLAVIANGNIRKDKIIQLKTAIQAETAEKLDISREKQHEKLEKALAMAIKTNSPAAMVSAIREQNEMLGYHRDKAPNSERRAQLCSRVSDEQQRILMECADLLLRKQIISNEIDKPSELAAALPVDKQTE